MDTFGADLRTLGGNELADGVFLTIGFLLLTEPRKDVNDARMGFTGITLPD